MVRNRFLLLMASLLVTALAEAGEPASIPADAATAGSAPTQATPAVTEEPANCIRTTGSRLPPPRSGCLNVSGQVVTGDELRATGATNVGEALRLASPLLR